MNTPSPMTQIELAALNHSQARAALKEEITALKVEREQLERRHRNAIGASLQLYRESRHRLEHLLNTHPELFSKPKTRVMHGLRIGFMKQKGKLIIKYPKKTIAAIKSLLSDRAQDLIQSKESIVKAAVGNLPAAELKRIGIEVTADTDAAVIKGTDDDLDKLIKALTDDEQPEEEDL